MNKEFYERILVAKFIQERFKENGKEFSLNDCFYYLQDKGDSESVDLVWLSICGNHVSWENHLEDVCFKILGVNRMQPGYCPFTVSEETLESDREYNAWFKDVWTPYINSLVVKYSHLWKTRLGSKIGRGMLDIVSIIEEYVGVSEEASEQTTSNETTSNETTSRPSGLSSSNIFG